jgi:hypothetical protein
MDNEQYCNKIKQHQQLSPSIDHLRVLVVVFFFFMPCNDMNDPIPFINKINLNMRE